MTDWNPNVDDVLGLEWVPGEIGSRVINGSSKCAALTFLSTVAEDPVDFLWLGLFDRLQVNKGTFWVDIFEEGEEIPGPVSTFTARPNGCAANAADAWKDAGGTPFAVGGAGLGTDIGEAALDVSDFAQYTGTYQNQSPLRIELLTNTFPGGRRVVGGRVIIVANRQDATGKLAVYIHGEAQNQNYALGEITVDTEVREFSIPFPEIAPWGDNWFESYIEDFDLHAPGSDGYTIRIKPVGVGKNKPLRVYQMYVEIDYVTEHRAAYGIADFTLRENDWVPFTPVDPLTFANWSKLADTSYTMLLRRLPKWTDLGSSTNIDAGVSEGGSVSWRYLAETPQIAAYLGREPWLPDQGMASYSPTLNSDGTVALMGEPGIRGYSFYMNAPSTPSVDGQPYIYHWVNTSSEDESRQYLTTTSGGTFDSVRLVLGPRDDAVDDVEIRVHRASDDVQFGSTITLTVDDLRANGVEVATPEQHKLIGNPGGVTHYLIELEFDTSPTLAGATQYYVTVEGPAGDTTSWESLVLSANDYSNLVYPGEPTFGGSTDMANMTQSGTAGVDIVDLPVTLIDPPAAVSGFMASIGTQTVITDQQCTTADWLVRDLEFAYLSWNTTILGDDFVAYEIQRTQDGGTTWENIFYITDEDASVAQDYEALRNVQATYRIRVMASWYTASPWSDEDSVTPVMDDCALLFVSNEFPEINQGYVDIGGSRSYKFLTADEKETHILVGRAYQVVTGPLEYRGDQFEADVVVWAGSVPDDTGRAQFDLIESLNTVATSYVCVLDETGRRWLADVAITDGDRQGSKTHTAKIKVIELTDEPSLVNAVPLPPGPFAVDFSLYEDGPIPESTGLRDAFLDIPDSQDEMGIRDGKLAVVDFRGGVDGPVDPHNLTPPGGRRGLVWRNTVSLTDNVSGVYDGSSYTGVDPPLPAFAPAIHINLDPDDHWVGIAAWFVPPPYSWGELGVIGWAVDEFSYLDMHLGLDFPELTDEVKMRSVGGFVSVEVNGVCVLGPCEIPAELLGSPIHGAQIDVQLDTDEGLGVMDGVIIESDSTPLATRSAPLTPSVGTAAETASSTTINVPYPDTIAAGETLYCLVCTKNGGSISAAGWTAVQGFGNAGGLLVHGLRKVATGSEAGNLTVTKSTAGIMAGVMFTATGDTDQTAMSGAYNGSASTSLTAPALQIFGPRRTLVWIAGTSVDADHLAPAGWIPLSAGVPGGEAVRLSVWVSVIDIHPDFPDPPIFNAFENDHFPTQVGTASASTTSSVGTMILHPDVGT